MTVPWTRNVAVEVWMVDQASHSYVVGLEDDERDRRLADLRHIVHLRFPDGTKVVPCETWLWTATRI